MKITNSGKYLGMFVGPHAGKSNWTEPFEKYKNRVHELNISGQSAISCIHKYNSTCAPVLSYVAQIADPPKYLTQTEMAALKKILHFATNSLSHGSFFALKDLFNIDLVNLKAYFKAIMFRTACKTLEHFEKQLREIQNVGFDSANLGDVSGDVVTPNGWDSPPIAQLLYNSLHGKNQSNEFKKGLKHMQ